MPSIVTLGEVLWDLFEHSRRLGGAALNFGVHARRLGHPVSLISAVGTDELGDQAAELIAAFDVDVRFLRRTSRFPTGTASVKSGYGGSTKFTIPRPAAYDDADLSARDLSLLVEQSPAWLYFGTLFASTDHGRSVLLKILRALPKTTRFYDLNLRPGADCPSLIAELLELADVVKLNEDELCRVHEFAGLPPDVESFCREASARYGWRAAAVTLGDRGCALYADGKFVKAGGQTVDVVDPVGAGDAFAAALVHGLSRDWPIAQTASFANRVGALVATRHGAIPDWTLEEAVSL